MASRKKGTTSQEPIAVIGMSCIFPQAEDVKKFWHNILNGVNAIWDPAEKWEAERYLKSGRITTPRGGYLGDLFRFDPSEFGIMPNSIDGGEPDQLLALQVAKRALEDAGSRYLDNDFDHGDTGIILGHSTYYHRGQVNIAQHNICFDQTLEILQAAIPGLTEEQREKIGVVLKSQLPQFNADMCPSEVPNVMTGRIANRLNFMGPNYLVDAACASSLLAVNAAVNELRSGNSRMMLAGGVNASLPAEVCVIFTLLDALSERGKVRPFEEGSDGTLLGEGLGVVVLKRLTDALEDGDRVYAIVHGVGQSSDGKGLGLLAPNEKGEILAMRRAYEQTGIDPASISLIEAHGTGIPLGDKTEISALESILGKRQGPQGNVAIGSVKSMISHCIPAAGMASMIKMCLALYHKVLPPTLCDKINPELGIGQTPLYINNTVRPWISKPGIPRRAAINSFGFGGVNAHAILEEAPETALRPPRRVPWPAELFVFSGNTKGDLEAQLGRLKDFIEARDDCYPADIAFTLALKAKENNGSFRLCLIASDRENLLEKIGQAMKRFEKSDKPLMGKGGVIFSNAPINGKMAFIFPGEGSQYIGMLEELATYFDTVRAWFDLWHGTYDSSPGESRTDIVFPPYSDLTSERRAELDRHLHEIGPGSEAVFIAGQAMNNLLESVGVTPDVMLGHSSGESSALVASRAIEADTPQKISKLIAQLNSIMRTLEKKGQISTGALMAIGLMPLQDIKGHIDGTDIVIAMENCPTQIIVFGGKEEIAKLPMTLAEAGAVCEILPFDRGYHTPSFTPMKEGFEQYYRDIGLGVSKIPLYSCASAGLFPQDAEGVRALASGQWITTVRFIDTISAMADDGTRLFIEVGPGGKLTSFTEQILREKGCLDQCLVAASNLESQPCMQQFLNLIGKLYVNQRVDATRLFEGREVASIDLHELRKPKLKGVILDNTMPRFHATPDLVQTLQSAITAPARQMDDFYPEYRSFFTSINVLTSTYFEGSVALNVDEDLFLQDHILSGAVSDAGLRGLSCVPIAVTLEIMAEASAMIAGRIDLGAIEDVRAYGWIVPDRNEVILDVRASAADGRYNVEVFIEGKKIMSALFTFGDPASQCASLAPLQGGMGYNRWDGDYEVYRNGMFHGPVFQAIPRFEWNDDGIDAQLSLVSLDGFFRAGDTPKTILNPVLMDAISQLPAFWILHKIGTGFNCFPTRIGRIELYGTCPENEAGMTLSARPKGSSTNPGEKIWDFECVDADGGLVLRASDFEFVHYQVEDRFYKCRFDPLNHWYGVPDETGQDGIREDLRWKLRHFPEEFCTQSSGIFLRIMAHCTLNATEREEFLTLSGNAQERINWLMRRICIKEAARFYIFNETGALLYPTDIEISFDASGKPLVNGWWQEEYGIEAPDVFVLDGRQETVVTLYSATQMQTIMEART